MDDYLLDFLEACYSALENRELFEIRSFTRGKPEEAYHAVEYARNLGYVLLKPYGHERDLYLDKMSPEAVRLVLDRRREQWD